MKLLVLLVLLTSAFNVRAEYEVEITTGVGVRYADDIALAVKYNYFITDQSYAQVKLITTADNKLPSNSFVFINYGYKILVVEKTSIHLLLGVGYASHPERDRYLTGHRQFNLGMFYKYKLNDKLTASFGWDHISNCSKLCWNNRRENLRPNKGRDYATVGINYEF